ncbi:hypothetical protein [Chroococcidiopsis thermalis]|uniref:Uncharacterized protein n=1 Tax=Chroococcidiopsis thermalis (strain PCC 7203) TaxID=251229 RepID=K9TWY6_CHRTP|nr:hypothetical protein [Chroococcidiopsis thermalis]AFY86701.1 hypothetical protein Chro_1174 [Chroococcidiopsis thermalis PCC 7203]
MKIEIPPLELTPAVTSGSQLDITFNQRLRQEEFAKWQESITSQYEVAEGCRPASIFDALIGRIYDPSLVLVNKGRKVKLVRVEGLRQLKTEGWCVVICRFNASNRSNIRGFLNGTLERAAPTPEQLEQRREDYKKYVAMMQRSTPALAIWA